VFEDYSGMNGVARIKNWMTLENLPRGTDSTHKDRVRRRKLKHEIVEKPQPEFCASATMVVVQHFLQNLRADIGLDFSTSLAG